MSDVQETKKFKPAISYSEFETCDLPLPQHSLSKVINVMLLKHVVEIEWNESEHRGEKFFYPQVTLLTTRIENVSPQPPELSSASTCVACNVARIADLSSSGVDCHRKCHLMSSKPRPVTSESMIRFHQAPSQIALYMDRMIGEQNDCFEVTQQKLSRNCKTHTRTP